MLTWVVIGLMVVGHDYDPLMLVWIEKNGLRLTIGLKKWFDDDDGIENCVLSRS